MTTPFATPQDAEDAFYDALEENDAAAMATVWETSDDIACLLPMSPLFHGRQVHELWQQVFEGGAELDIQVKHMRWIEMPELAIHLIEETVTAKGSQPAQPVYATNVYRNSQDGWHLVLHQNSPTQPPQGVIPPRSE